MFKGLRSLLVLVALLSLAGACGKGSVKGSLESKGGVLGDWVLSSGKCFSGQRENYFGVVAFGPEEEGTSVKLVKDPTSGYTLVTNIPSTCAKQAEKSACRAIVIKESDCATFNASISRTNTTINDIRKIDASLVVDCTLKDGGTLKGQLNFDGCH